MKLYHIIDSGNTNLKLTSFDASGSIMNHLTGLSTAELQLRVEKMIANGESVASCSVNLEISNVINFESIKTTLDINSTYSNEIGNDRLALVYYFQKSKSESIYTVINIGTFITLDFIENGIHIGGYIFLGPQTYLDCYHKNGKNLPILKIEDLKPSALIPNQTNEAILQSLNIYMDKIFEQAKGEIHLTGAAGKFFKRESVNYDDFLLAKSLFYIFDRTTWKITN